MKDKRGKILTVLGAVWVLAAVLIALIWWFDQPAIEISWQTETEFGSAGFNILRSEEKSGPFVQINERLIPASSDAAAGADYSFVDSSVEAGLLYYYELEDVELDGNTTQLSLVAAEARGKQYWVLALAVGIATLGLILIYSGQKKSAVEVTE